MLIVFIFSWCFNLLNYKKNLHKLIIFQYFSGDTNWYSPQNPSKFEKSASVDSEKNLWLFDIENDPNEREDLSDLNPEIVRFLLDRLAYYNSTAVPVRFPDLDPDAFPSKHGVWGPWVE